MRKSSKNPLSPLARSLIAINFSENEAKIYLALLELGKGRVSEITRKAGLNRTTGYDVLDGLVSRGLASMSGKKPRQEYIAESPDKLASLLDTRLEEAKTQLGAVQRVIPELKSLHTVAGRPSIRFYEGLSGLVEVYEDTLTAHEPIRAYATVDDMHRTLPKYFPEYYKRRAGKGIAIRAIIPSTAVGRERAAHDAEEMREMALIPPDQFYFSPEINVYDDKVMIASWREKLGIIIQSAEIADAMKKIHALAWQEAKRLHAKVERPDANHENQSRYV